MYLGNMKIQIVLIRYSYQETYGVINIDTARGIGKGKVQDPREKRVQDTRRDAYEL